jgi:catechol 2,3-dioxygenase-like lactoylglutathione lyase family enzyme
MPAIKHMAICTHNNRRLARFYQLILGMEEVWNAEENSPYPFYVTDGYFNLNCLQIYPALAEEKREVGINHYGFKIEDLTAIEKRFADLDPSIRLASRPRDGRYTEFRIRDPDGNGVDITEKGWGSEREKRLPAIRHVGIGTEDPNRLAEFYKFVFSMKEVERKEIPATGTRAIYLSDGITNLGLIKNSPVPKPGIQLLGFQVQSVSEIEERLKWPYGLTYRGEPPLEIRHRPSESPYKNIWLQDPDGNCVDLSEEGWKV